MKKYLLARLPGRAFLPSAVFTLIFIAHYLWKAFFPENWTIQSQWLSFKPATETTLWQRYIETQGYYMGFSYALSFTFAAIALRRYMERRSCASRNIALGGVTFSGGLSALGCFLIGCCGSPMFAVYLNFFGASFLPLAKPVMAAFTAVSIGIAWWWMRKGSGYTLKSISASDKDTCNCTERRY